MSTIETASFEERLRQAARFREKYIDRVPIVIQNDERCSLPRTMHNNLFIIPKNNTAGDLLALIRKKTYLPKTQAIAMFVGHQNLVMIDMTLSELYERYSDNDGFLYILCTDHEVFGN
ncbi:unnamed protein product [Blepharisma stoltei]|uniref:Autophagy-related protein n=1 Tax=Blepharisma stoltei TaxID=1481888 RepID=A0AAU9JLW5_9CILI|nr:unnamed protein product [Blepharisma stoltei]